MVKPENHTLALLREIRGDIADLSGRMDKMQKRLDEMHLNGMKALKGFVGHRTMVERTIGSFEDQVARLETRVATLEARA